MAGLDVQKSGGGENMADLNAAWADILKDEFSKEYYRKLYFFMEEEYKTTTV